MCGLGFGSEVLSVCSILIINGLRLIGVVSRPIHLLSDLQEEVSAGVNSSGADLPDDIANKMSLFYANPTPMLNTLSGATEKLIQEVRGKMCQRDLNLMSESVLSFFLFTQNPSLTMANATDCFGTMASVCRVLNENP